MIVIVVLDDRNGMMFNHRRQSQDRILREEILSLTAGGRLWMNSYSARQFVDHGNRKQIVVDEDFIRMAEPEDFCFFENILPDMRQAEKLILFRWNRKYPGDLFFSIDWSGWTLTETGVLVGSSHEKITKEVYIREKL